ncbi:M23 family metallopeptidase [Ornithobacterium rhinotracheale]|uniref:M23 family metallopeptidase n=1 Tax=Ornithobacterium rhinotracheale TaxID=28251 RepID=A0A3R5UYR4_ORNRH|nr:M23 family metallopeptidase [Ornithobacterium rhinotracheale]QAR31603.1 M23 family metallopeptidase [Ornithobacterium rhinotracheale]
MEKPRKKFRPKLTDHYSVQIQDLNTEETMLSYKLNVLNVLLLVAFFTLFIIGATFVVMRYTPLKSYILPEQNTPETLYKKQLLELNERLLSIEDSLQHHQRYISSVQAVVGGKIKAEQVDSLMAKQEKIALNSEYLKPTEQDSLFRLQIAQEEMEAITKAKKQIDVPLYFVPAKGVLTAKYDLTEKHLAVDIAAKTGESIKAVEGGDVVLAEWIPETGYTVIIRHPNDVISVYKHASKVFKKTGDVVEKGEVIAEVGNSGEQTTGPHLHFELWVRGKAVDPEEYINFN